jgi:uncharacterized protein with von Willebrand factor type A (vWA) domain
MATTPKACGSGRTQSRHQRAVKVWDRREFRNLDGDAEIGTRTMKLALRRLRRWAREGAAEELDLDGTIRATAAQGWLDVQTRPERRNAVKVLLLLDIGGSMDPHVKVMEELFTAAKAEFRHLEVFYFHNCVYEGLWRDNRRRWDHQTPTWEVIRTYGPDWRLILVGDAAMSPYEVTHPGGANEHWNREAGAVWLATAARAMAASCLDQPGGGAGLGPHAVDPADPRYLRGPDGADDAGRAGAGGAGAAMTAGFAGRRRVTISRP